MTQCSKSVRKTAPNKTQVSRALATGLLRAIGTAGGKGSLADSMDTSTKTIDRALIGDSIPGIHTALAALLVDPTALDELLRLYGFCLRPLTAEAANDMDTAAKLSFAAGAMIEALADGIRDHRETLAMADIFRPLIQSMGAIISEADALRGAA